MAYVATNYKTNPAAPAGKWVCNRLSSSKPYDAAPPANVRGATGFCGQCVSYVTRVCPSVPIGTASWRKGKLVKGDQTIAVGTAIATFDSANRYSGHAAIYEGQNKLGLQVYDQWVTGTPKAIGPRTLTFGAHGNSNNGDLFYVID